MSITHSRSEINVHMGREGKNEIQAYGIKFEVIPIVDSNELLCNLLKPEQGEGKGPTTPAEIENVTHTVARFFGYAPAVFLNAEDNPSGYDESLAPTEVSTSLIRAAINSLESGSCSSMHPESSLVLKTRLLCAYVEAYARSLNTKDAQVCSE